MSISQENEPIRREASSAAATKSVKKTLAPLVVPLQAVPVPQEQQHQLYATDGSHVNKPFDKYVPQHPSPAANILTLAPPPLATHHYVPQHEDMAAHHNMASSPALSYGSAPSPPDSADFPTSFPASPFQTPYDMPMLSPINIAGMPGSPMAGSPMSLSGSPLMYSPYGSPYAPFTGISFVEPAMKSKGKAGPLALVCRNSFIHHDQVLIFRKRNRVVPSTLETCPPTPRLMNSSVSFVTVLSSRFASCPNDRAHSFRSSSPTQQQPFTRTPC